jgi:hypothetical protein
MALSGRRTLLATLPPPLPALTFRVRVLRVGMVSTMSQEVYKRDCWWTVAVRRMVHKSKATTKKRKSYAVVNHGSRAQTTKDTTIAYITADINAKVARAVIF